MTAVRRVIWKCWMPSVSVWRQSSNWCRCAVPNWPPKWRCMRRWGAVARRWTAIRAEVQRAFNARLSAHGLRPGAWKVGDNPVDRLLGKELCVLAWAVEQMEMEKIPVAVRNWLALRPEERWWLFGMTAMSTGGVMDAGKGWRAALKHALGDVAQSELLAPRARRGKPEQEVAQASLGLFGDEAP